MRGQCFRVVGEGDYLGPGDLIEPFTSMKNEKVGERCDGRTEQIVLKKKDGGGDTKEEKGLDLFHWETYYTGFIRGSLLKLSCTCSPKSIPQPHESISPQISRPHSQVRSLHETFPDHLATILHNILLWSCFLQQLGRERRPAHRICRSL